MVQFLVQKGAPFEELSDQYETPLQWASFIGDIDIVRYLLLQGAHPLGQNNQTKTNMNDWKTDPLYDAVLGGNKEVLSVLVRYLKYLIQKKHNYETDESHLVLPSISREHLTRSVNRCLFFAKDKKMPVSFNMLYSYLNQFLTSSEFTGRISYEHNNEIHTRPDDLSSLRIMSYNHNNNGRHTNNSTNSNLNNNLKRARNPTALNGQKKEEKKVAALLRDIDSSLQKRREREFKASDLAKLYDELDEELARPVSDEAHVETLCSQLLKEKGQ